MATVGKTVAVTEPLLYGQINDRLEIRCDSPSAYVGCLRGNARRSTVMFSLVGKRHRLVIRRYWVETPAEQ